MRSTKARSLAEEYESDEAALGLEKFFRGKGLQDEEIILFRNEST